MLIAFRVDASRQIGGGHLARCLALADALIPHGAHVLFILRGGEKAGGVDLARRGVTQHWIPAGEPDAEGTRRILQGLPERPAWLVVDHYGLAAPWERSVADLVGRILVIDDLADRPHDCDVLVDQSSLESNRYAALVPSRCQIVLGLEHALLRPEFAAARAVQPARPPGVRSILVSLGSADPDNVTLQVIQGYQELDGSAPRLVVVAGHHNPHIASLTAACTGDERISLHVGVERMSDVLVGSDLAIGAVGVSMWERCCLGVPSLVVGLTPAQDDLAEQLARRGLVRYLGPSHMLGPASYQSAVMGALGDPGPVRDMAVRASAFVDGRGAERVAAIMSEHDV